MQLYQNWLQRNYQFIITPCLMSKGEYCTCLKNDLVSNWGLACIKNFTLRRKLFACASQQLGLKSSFADPLGFCGNMSDLMWDVLSHILNYCKWADHACFVQWQQIKRLFSNRSTACLNNQNRAEQTRTEALIKSPEVQQPSPQSPPLLRGLEFEQHNRDQLLRRWILTSDNS